MKNEERRFVESTSDFIKECLENLPDKGTRIYYRGVNDATFAMSNIPSIYYPDNFFEKEREIFDEVVSIFPDEMLAQKTTVEKLILMQHYRFPTRIMDVSLNPLVGLFFACFSDGKDKKDEKNKRDGVVRCYKVPDGEVKTCDSDTVRVISNIARCKSKFCLTAAEKVQFNNKKSEAGNELHYEIGKEQPNFYQAIDPEDLYKVICLRPRMNNPRIIRQEGRFFLFGISNKTGKGKSECASFPPKWIQEPIYIRAKAKERILRELDAMGIQESFFYPDFEHVSHVIRERFSSKRKRKAK